MSLTPAEVAVIARSLTTEFASVGDLHPMWLVPLKPHQDTRTREQRDRDAARVMHSLRRKCGVKVLEELRADGVTVSLDGETLRISGRVGPDAAAKIERMRECLVIALDSTSGEVMNQTLGGSRKT